MGSVEDPYPRLMETSRETWDSVEVAGAPTWYYSTTMKDHPPRTAQFPGGTGIYAMGHKDLLAYRWALDSMRDWDFMARVNASCYVRKTLLFDHVQTLPATGLMRGLVAPKGDGTMYMWGGAQFIMSRDVVKAMVNNQDKWQHDQMEDVSMSRLTAELGILHDGNGRSCSINQRPGGWMCFTYNSGPGFDFKDFSEFKEKAGDQFFIRVKQDGDREKDMWIMRELWRQGLV